MKKIKCAVVLAVVAGFLVTESMQAAMPLTEREHSGQEVESAAREARAKSLPALRQIPRETAGVVAAAGTYAPMLAAALAEQLQMPSSDVVQSVASIAVSVGKDGAQTCRELLEIQGIVQQLATLSHLKHFLAGPRDGAGQSAAQASLQGLYEEHVNALKDRFATLHMTPVYIVLTAAAGKEDSFQKFAEQIEKELTLFAGGPNGIRGAIELPVDNLVDNLADDLELPAAEREKLSAELIKRKFYLLVEHQSSVLRIALVADKPAVSWPTDETQSLLAAPELNGMDAHVQDIQLTAWLSPEIQAVLQNPDNMLAVLLPLHKLFSDLAKNSAGDAQTFAAAARGVETLRRMSEKMVSPKLPMTLQIRRDGRDTRAEFAADACGCSFKPGVLQHAKLAHNSAIYFETTAFCNPNKLDYSAAPDALLDILAGVYLMMGEELKDRLSMGMMLMQQFRPQISAVRSAFSKIGDSFATPMALVIRCREGKNTSGAVRFTVTNRATMVEGWRDFILQLKTIAGALATPPSLLDHLPFLSQPTLNGGTRYVLAFPLADNSYEPQLVLDESKLVLATDRASADALSQDSTASEPFCGAVFALDIDEAFCTRNGGKFAKTSGEFIEKIQGQATVQDGILLVKMQVISK